MKYICIFILLISLSCCNNNKTANQHAATKKSYSAAEQQKVIGDINFGISKKQFEQLYQKFLESKKCKSGCKIGEFEYYTASPKFKNDKLYYLEFVNFGSKHDGHDKFIPEIVNDAYQYVKSEYGEPDSSQSLHSWTQGQSFTAYKWRVGEKMIEIIADRIDMELGVRLVIYKL